MTPPQRNPRLVRCRPRRTCADISHCPPSVHAERHRSKIMLAKQINRPANRSASVARRAYNASYDESNQRRVASSNCVFKDAKAYRRQAVQRCRIAKRITRGNCLSFPRRKQQPRHFVTVAVENLRRHELRRRLRLENWQRPSTPGHGKKTNKEHHNSHNDFSRPARNRSTDLSRHGRSRSADNTRSCSSCRHRPHSVRATSDRLG